MAKSISSIYDSNENLVPFYPDVVYSQSKGMRPKDEIELKLDKMDEDAMFLKRTLGVSYEQVLRWFRGDATNLDRNECEEAMKRLLSNCEEKVRNHLIDICSRYSLPIMGASIYSQKTSSPSSEVKSDITPIKQVGTTNGQGATHLKQEVQVEVLDEKGILPSRDGSLYWKWYYDRWDDFVRSWFEERRGNPICTEYKRIVDGYRKCVKDLNCDELPEPYQGDPKSGVDAVVLNLNPGMSQKGHYGSYEGNDLEATKFYSNIDVSSELVPSGWLIKKFRDEANCSYRDYVTRWSCLNPDLRRHEPEVCGVYWWQVDGRMNWVRQIYGNDQLCSSRVFAPEICPFHSKSLPTDDFQELNSFISEHVIVPTMMAVIENKLPFAVAIGKAFAILLERIGRDDKFGISAKLEKEWWEESDDVEDWQWPEARDDETGEMRRVHRKYCLFALKDKNGYLARFLVCAAPGSNGTPSEDFGRNIEKKLILSYVRDTPLTAELYEKIKPFPLRWWSHSNQKKWNNGSKAHTIKTESVEISQSQRPDDVRLLSALTTVAQSMCKDADTHNFQLFLWQREGVKLYLRFTKLRPHITFNCWVDDKQAFADKYGERLLAFAEAQGLKGFLGKDHSVGNGLQFKPIKPIDLDNVNCNELQEWSDMIITKLSEILK